MRSTQKLQNLLKRLIMSITCCPFFFQPKTFTLPDNKGIHAEISTIRDAVRGNQSTAKMRFQFWRDALESIYDPSRNRSIPNHPTVIALENACREGRLGRQWLERCLERKRGRNVRRRVDQPIRHGRICGSCIFIADLFLN